jgi:hypothetical protein
VAVGRGRGAEALLCGFGEFFADFFHGRAHAGRREAFGDAGQYVQNRPVVEINVGIAYKCSL